MNDTELDLLLNTWKAPAVPPSVRDGLLARFPRAENRTFARPLGWALVIAVASVTLAIGMEQSGENHLNVRIVDALERLHEDVIHGIMQRFEAWRATSIVAQIRQSEPKVYVNGKLGAPLEYGGAARIKVQVPGEGAYSIILYRGGLTGWLEAGHIHGRVIEFQAGGTLVRIECNKPIVDADRPVFVMRQP